MSRVLPMETVLSVLANTRAWAVQSCIRYSSRASEHLYCVCVCAHSVIGGKNRAVAADSGSVERTFVVCSLESPGAIAELILVQAR